MNFCSQSSQDKILFEKFFSNQSTGTFVDIGAHDGITISNTYFYEKLGWTGICVEPIEARYIELVNNRPKSLCLYGCAYSSICTLQFREIIGYSEMLSGIEKTYDPRHLDRISNEISQVGGGYKVVSKPAFSLQSVFDKMNLTLIDYMSIDTEGSELDILKGIDFTKTNVKVLDVENNYPDDLTVKNYLKNFGYSLSMRIGGDDIFVKM